MVSLFANTFSNRTFDLEQMYAYIHAYASEKQMEQTLIALPLARKLHENQFRKGNDRIPYVCHPLMMSCHALALGFDDDNLIAVTLLHDVCEDCGVSSDELPVNPIVQTAVALLTRNQRSSLNPEKEHQHYFASIAGNKIASIVKLLDRCNNVSAMASAFSKEKMQRYIKETQDFIYPLFHSAQAHNPEYAPQILLVNYHLVSVVESLKQVLN